MESGWSFSAIRKAVNYTDGSIVLHTNLSPRKATRPGSIANLPPTNPALYLLTVITKVVLIRRCAILALSSLECSCRCFIREGCSFFSRVSSWEHGDLKQGQGMCNRGLRLCCLLAYQTAPRVWISCGRDCQGPRYLRNIITFVSVLFVTLIIILITKKISFSFGNPQGNHQKTAHLWKLPGAKERLQIVRADLLEEGSFDSAVMACEGVFHTASPVLAKPDSSSKACHRLFCTEARCIYRTWS